VLSTAGGLVFSGSDEGNFYALDAWTGKPLWVVALQSQTRAKRGQDGPVRLSS
jgi:outer membrane protein assembly factor BamB